jgi:excisionase family DNA binding protein
LTRAGVALLLGVSPNTVSRWAREGKLTCQLTLGGHRRFDRREIEELSRRMRAEGGAAAR